MQYLFICEDCHRVYSKEIPLEAYSTLTVFFCPWCHSSNTRRFFREIPTIIYKDDGFTKYVKEE